MTAKFNKLALLYNKLISAAMLCISALSPTANAELPQQFKFHQLYMQSALDSDSAYEITRDHEGYLWIGTDSGLKRYNGYTFKNFVSDPTKPGSLGSSIAISLLVQRDGTLWAAGSTLNRYHSETESFTSYDFSMGGVIWALLEDADGLIWFGGEGFGLKAYNKHTDTLVHELMNEGESLQDKPFIGALTNDPDGENIWVAANNGLYRVDRHSGETQRLTLPWRFGYGTDGVKDLIVSQQGDLWVATQKGLARIDPKSGDTQVYLHEPNNSRSLSTNALWSVFQDSQGRIWIGTDKKGVHLYQPETDDFLHIPASDKEYAIPPASVDDIYEDENGSLWFAIRQNGVRRLSPHLEKFRTLKTQDDNPNSLAFNNVLSLLEDDQGSIWIATDGGGLDIYDPNTERFSHITKAQGLTSDSVISLAQTNNLIWAGTWAGGINVIDQHSRSIVKQLVSSDQREENRLGNNNIFRLQPSKDNTGIWVSVWRRGIQYYDIASNRFQHYPGTRDGHPFTIHNIEVNDFIEDGETLWVGGNSGLERLDLKTNRSVPVHMGITQSVMGLYLDDRTLWIASATGLHQLDTSTLKINTFTKRDGLSDNYVTSIEKDRLGTFWLGTRSGLNRFDPQMNTFEHYDERDGLVDSQFNTFSHLYSRSGVMYFGGPKGLNMFNPENMPKNHHAPQVVLDKVEVSGMPLKVTEPQTQPLNLSPEHRDITFEFAALSYISPTQNRYRYILEGQEKTWNEVDGSQRRVRYTNLSPGAYTFRVFGSNNDDVWSEKDTHLSFKVLPPWWMTWWARALYVLAMAAIVYGFIYWRLTTVRQREVLLRKLVHAKTQELETAHKSLTELNKNLENRVEERARLLSIETEERKAAEEKLFYMAFHDPLTGLPNRAWLLDELEKLIAQHSVNPSIKFGLMFLDGDHFKQVNDTYGHLMGDRLLQEAARRLASSTSEQCQAARLGGDEFTVLVTNIRSADDMQNISKKIINAFTSPFKIDDQELHFRVTIGAVFCDNTHRKPEFLLRDADIAMYRAKDIGRGTYQLFDARMREEAQEMAELERDMLNAIERDEFHLVFQPILDCKTGTLASFEALIRWHHSKKGLIPPDKFIPLAEENGAIATIGAWVLHNACRQMTRWNNEFDIDRDITVAVNISSRQLKQLDFIEVVDSILHNTGLDSRQLKLEITESEIMDNSKRVNESLNALRERGIELAIDDFGTGYSSLSYLDTLPVQYLKIDRKFVSALAEDTPDNEGTIEIVRATISLAHSLKLLVIAEGVETRHQYDFLQSLGCDFAQGYHIAKPMMPEDATVYIEHSLNQDRKPISSLPANFTENVNYLKPAKKLRLRDRRRIIVQDHK